MNKLREIPWPRILAEGTAIVVSILLAFSIQAWWENRQDREDEQDYLRLLTDDLDRDFDVLGAMDKSILAKSEGAQLINSITTESSISIKTVEAALTDLTFVHSYDVQRATYQGLRDSAQLHIILDPSLRSLLSTYYEISQPKLLDAVIQYNQFQQQLRGRIGRHARWFPPEEFETLWPLPDDGDIVRLLTPPADLQMDLELINDIAEIGGRGYQLSSWIEDMRLENRKLVEEVSDFRR